MEQVLSRNENASPPQKELLNARQVAARLGYANENTVYVRMKNDDTFPRPIKFGRLSRWHVEDIDAWFSSQVDPTRAENAQRLRIRRDATRKASK